MASNRRTAAAALAVVLASVSLYPVFIGLTWFWAGCGSVAVVALAGTATRLRRLPVPAVLALGAVALLLYLNLAFSNGRSLAHLLPTPASLAELWHLAGQGFTEASRYAPPVPQLRGMVLLAAAGIGIAALATDLIAVRLGSAALAGLPLLLLVTEPFTLSVARGWIGTVIAFSAAVAGYLTLLSSEAQDRIRDWEHRDAGGRDGAGPGRPDTRPLAAAGRRVGFASVVLALCLPLAVPGLHATRLFGAGQPGIGGSGGGHGGGAGFPSPLSQVSAELHATQASPVLDYTTSAAVPDYLQIYALDKLTDSAGWQLFAQPAVLAAVTPRLPPPPGLATLAGTTTQTTRIVIADGTADDSLDALPVPYPATAVSAGGTLRADRSTLMVFDSGVSLGGLRYTVASLAADPPAQSLNSVTAPPADIAAHYLAVPAAYRPLTQLADRVAAAAGAKTAFQKAAALQDWLAGGTFGYTLNAPSVVNAAGLEHFLTVSQKGYCQQFAYAMAVLARLLGIPSRVAVGFTAGTHQSGNSWLVTTHDAHAWPELYFQGYGWLRFEPTPSGSAGQGSARAPGYSLTPANPSASSPAQAAPSVSPSPSASGTAGRQLPPGVSGTLGNDGIGSTAAARAGLSPWAVLGLVLAGLVVIAAVAPWVTRRVIRRRRWHGGGGRGAPGRRVPDRGAPGRGAPDRVRARDVAWAHAAWLELRDDLLDHGAGTRPSESPRAAAERAGQRLSLTGPARDALGRIALAEERARYAPGPADGSGLRADSTVARRAIAAAVPRGVRWRARLLPSSVLGRAAAGLAAAADRYRWPRDRRRARRFRAVPGASGGRQAEEAQRAGGQRT